MFYWLMKNLVVGPIILTAFRPWVRGLENVPKDGAVILASNHLSFVDSVFLPLVLDRRVVFLAKSDYFTGKGIKGWATRVFFKATGQLPIDRSGGKASEASLNTGLQVLGRGDLLHHGLAGGMVHWSITLAETDPTASPICAVLRLNSHAAGVPRS